MCIVLQASSRANGTYQEQDFCYRQAVDVRNAQGSTHCVLKRDSSIHL